MCFERFSLGEPRDIIDLYEDIGYFANISLNFFYPRVSPPPVVMIRVGHWAESVVAPRITMDVFRCFLECNTKNF